MASKTLTPETQNITSDLSSTNLLPILVDPAQIRALAYDLKARPNKQKFTIDNHTYSRTQCLEAILKGLKIFDNQSLLRLSSQDLDTAENLDKIIFFINESLSKEAGNLPANLQELVAEHQKHLDEKIQEQADNGSLNLGNIKIKDQIAIIQKLTRLYEKQAQFTAGYIEPLKQSIKTSLYSNSDLDLKNPEVARQVELAIQKTAERIVASAAIFAARGNTTFDPKTDTTVLESLHNTQEGMMINNRDVNAVIIDYAKNNLITPQKSEKLAQSAINADIASKVLIPDFDYVVAKYRRYGLNKQEAFKAAEAFENIHNQPADIAFVKAGKQVRDDFEKVIEGRVQQEVTSLNKQYDQRLIGVTDEKRRQVVESDRQTALTRHHQFILAETKAIQRNLSNFKESGNKLFTQDGELVITHVVVGGQRISLNDLQRTLNASRSEKGLTLFSQNDIRLALLGGHAFEKIANHDYKLLEENGIQIDKNVYETFCQKYFTREQDTSIISQVRLEALKNPRLTEYFSQPLEVDESKLSQLSFFRKPQSHHISSQTHETVAYFKDRGFEMDVQDSGGNSLIRSGWRYGISRAWTKTRDYVGGKISNWAVTKGIKGFIGKGLQAWGSKLAAKGLGKLVGTAIGSVIGGPVGTVIGFVAGLVVDKLLKPVMGFLQKHWQKIAAAGLGYFLAPWLALLNLASTLFTALTSTIGITTLGGATIGFFVGGPIGALIGAGAGYLAGQLGTWITAQGGIGGLTSSLGSLLGSGVSSLGAGSLSATIAAAPIIAVGTVLTTNFLNTQMLASVFFLPPGEEINQGFAPAITGAVLPGMPECWPTTGTITQCTNGSFSHQGTNWNSVDIASNEGTSIYATHDGRITNAGWMSGFGRLVMIEGTSDEGAKYTTYYAHLLSISPNAALGKEVKKGLEIGKMDNTGYSTGSHLHYELRGINVNVVDTINSGSCANILDPATLGRIKNGCTTAAECNASVTQTVKP